MMSLRKAKAAVAVLAAATLLATGVVIRSDDARGQNSPAGATEADLRQKAQARVDAAQNVLTMLEQRLRSGELITPSFLDLQAGWMRRLAEAKIDATDNPAARVRAAEQYIQQCRNMLAIFKARAAYDTGGFQVAQAEYYLADAEYLLAKMQGK